MTKKINLAVLLSGGGTTLQNLIDRIAAGKLDAEVRLVISSRADAYGIVRAQQQKIPVAVIPSKKYKNLAEHSAAICAELKRHPIDLIVMAGFMCFWHIPPEYAGRVMNIHPALIPAFCGKGMYGHIVHESVIKCGCKVSGCTVHFADNKYDHGPMIIQRTCPVLDDDTPETLAQRVFKQECKAYPAAIQLFAEGRLRIAGRRTRILARHAPLTGEPCRVFSLPALAKREAELLAVLAKRVSIEEMELQLGLRRDVLEEHLSQLQRRLGLASRAALFDYAFHWVMAKELGIYTAPMAIQPVGEAPPAIDGRRKRILPPPADEISPPSSVGEKRPRASDLSRLTRRETEIFRMVATGATVEELERRLDMKHNTLDVYLSRLKRKLGLESKEALQRYAVRWAATKESEK